MTDKERWLHDRVQAIQARRDSLAGEAAGPTLTPQEHLAVILWLMARSMGDAGDLAAARASDPTYLRDALATATRLDCCWRSRRSR